MGSLPAGETLAIRPRRPRRGKRIRIFAQLRPAAPGASLTARVQFRRRGKSAWVTRKTVGVHGLRNYLVTRVKARRTGDWRVAWGAGGSGSVSRTVFIKVRRPAA